MVGLDVVRNPGDQQRIVRIDARAQKHGEESRADARRADGNGVADHHYKRDRDGDDGASPQPVRQPRETGQNDARHDVNGDREVVYGTGLEAHPADEGGEEDTELFYEGWVIMDISGNSSSHEAQGKTVMMGGLQEWNVLTPNIGIPAQNKLSPATQTMGSSTAIQT